ncbi:Bromodomain associated protein [Gracilaria domingensis]|nr:Bromodomain associated protein [Gracilaria domingensis]
MQTTQVLERYRKLFGSLSNVSLNLSDAEFSAAQQAAKSSETWRTHFLSPSSVNLRLALSHALLESLSIRYSDDVRYEHDEGMMDGDDGGYTTPMSLLEDDRNAACSIPCYELLGSSAGQSPSVRNSPPYQSPSTVLLSEQALKQLTECRQSPSPGAQAFGPLFSELQAIVRKAQMRELRHPDQLADVLQTLIDKQEPPVTVRELLQTSIADARRCAQAYREQALVTSKADTLLTGLLSSNASKSALAPRIALRPPRKRPRAPTFASATARPAPSASLHEMLGHEHPITKNVYGLRRYHAWRSTVVATLLQKRGELVSKKEAVISHVNPRAKSPRMRVKKGRKDLLEIFNDVERAAVPATQDRFHATMLSSCALMLSHAGFSHASTNALNLLVDVVEEFIMQMGASLCTVRENVDNAASTQVEGSRRRKTPDENAEELKIICGSGAKGAFLDLLYHMKIDAQRISMKIQEAEKRLEHQVLSDKNGAALFQDPQQAKLIDDTVRAELHNLPRPSEIKGGLRMLDAPISEEDVKLDDEPFVFGYLCESVRLDVLGDVTVPVRAVYGKKTPVRDGIVSGRIERVQRSPRPKSKNASLQSTSVSSPSTPLAPVKAEVKFVDIGDG